MPPSLVQSNFAAGYSCAFLSNVTKGNFLVAFALGQNGGQTPAPTDTLGNTWKQQQTFHIRGGDLFGISMFTAFVTQPSGADTLTIGGYSSSFPGLYIFEFAGVFPNGIIDTSAVGGGVGTNMFATASVANPIDLVIAAFFAAAGGGSISTLNAAWTATPQGGVGTNFACIFKQCSPGTNQATATQSASTGWAAAIVGVQVPLTPAIDSIVSWNANGTANHVRMWPNSALAQVLQGPGIIFAYDQEFFWERITM